MSVAACVYLGKRFQPSAIYAHDSFDTAAIHRTSSKARRPHRSEDKQSRSATEADRCIPYIRHHRRTSRPSPGTSADSPLQGQGVGRSPPFDATSPRQVSEGDTHLSLF